MKPSRSKKPTWTEFTRTDDNAIWKIDDWVSFANTFDPIGEHELGEFDAWARKYDGPYLCARMVYGIMPIIAPMNADAECLQPLPKEEAAKRLGTSVEQVEFQIEMLQIQWRKYLKERPLPKAKEPPPGPAPDMSVAAPLVVSTPTQSNSVLPTMDRIEQCVLVVEAFGFDATMFDIPGRPDKVRLIEIEWFAERLMELKRMFDEPMAKTLARQAMMNELQLRRADNDLSKIPIASTNFWNIHDKKIKLEERYENQWKQLEEICPYIKGAMQKQGVHACISEFIKADQEWVAGGNRVRIDEVFTALEIQILLRASVQQPIPMYRPGWVMAVRDAMENLHNPTYKRLLPDIYFRVMDDALRDTFTKAVEAGLITLIDLENDSPKGEWPPLILPPPDAVKEAVDAMPAGIPVLDPDAGIPDVEASLEESGQ